TPHVDSTSCPFYLWHKDSASNSIYLPYPPYFENIASIGSLIATGNYDNGAYYDFYFLAHYVIGAGEGTRDRYDTIWGHSCIPLLNCNTCSGPPQTIVSYNTPIYYPFNQFNTFGEYWSNYNTPPQLGTPKIPAVREYDYPDSNIVGGGHHAIIAGSGPKAMYYPFTATSSIMEIEIVPPISPVDTPFSKITRIVIDSLSDTTYYVIGGSSDFTDMGDTLPVMVIGGLDSGRVYYAQVNRSICDSCPTHSISYFGLKTIDETPFEGNTAKNITTTTSVASGPNLVYDGDFETVPGFAPNPAECYNIASSIYPASPLPPLSIYQYPTSSPNMRFDSCNFVGYNGDRTDIYLVGNNAGFIPGTTRSNWRHNPHSGTHFMLCDAPSTSCTKCDLAPNPYYATLLTTDEQSIAWTQTVQTTPGTIYNFSVWVENLDVNNNA
ncbi:MAG TPA: hypothetical protein VN922_13355, partial [Bacteroidia bacterium]|nr:hypothetical protein [Bacteroidia bacterium]